MNKKVDFPQGTLPINGELIEQVKSFNTKELYWLSGYCSGLADAKQSSFSAEGLPAAQTAAQVSLKTLVLYASQSGNAQKLAEQLHQTLGQKGVKSELASVAEFKTNQLKQQQLILMVASTHGEGEPPDDAIDFHEFVLGKRAPKLEGVHHAVLSLGDSSYEFFCQTGKDFDKAFSQLGSKVLVERVDCDLDYEQAAAEWIATVVDKAADLSNVNVATESTSDGLSGSATRYSKESPFTATVLENQQITGRGSVKNIHHLEISLADSGISYQPGDSLGIWAKNDIQVVNEILSLSQLTGDEEIQLKETSKPLRQALLDNLEITLLNKEFITNYAELTDSDDVKNASENFADFIKNHQVVDVLKLAPTKLAAQQLADLLKPVKPRMYSIASSLEASPEEVHLTVGLQVAENNNGIRLGSASNYLINELKEDDEVLVFVEENRHFKLPAEDKAVLMIGPGTGIAPFRAFLQERAETGASGENWLFFGNPNFNTDFLYQVELQKYLKQKNLSRLDVAFSRDQQQKIYVQDRLLENAKDVWHWLNEKNASVYVCGDMSRMAKDVESALLEIIETQGNQSKQQAIDFLKQLKKDKRYQRDVY